MRVLVVVGLRWVVSMPPKPRRRFGKTVFDDPFWDKHPLRLPERNSFVAVGSFPNYGLSAKNFVFKRPGSRRAKHGLWHHRGHIAHDAFPEDPALGA